MNCSRKIFVVLAVASCALPSALAGESVGGSSVITGVSAAAGAVELSGTFPAQSYRAKLWCSVGRASHSQKSSQLVSATVVKKGSGEIDLTLLGAPTKGCCELIMNSGPKNPVLTAEGEIPFIELSSDSNCPAEPS